MRKIIGILLCAVFIVSTAQICSATQVSNGKVASIDCDTGIDTVDFITVSIDEACVASFIYSSITDSSNVMSRGINVSITPDKLEPYKVFKVAWNYRNRLNYKNIKDVDNRINYSHRRARDGLCVS